MITWLRAEWFWRVSRKLNRDYVCLAIVKRFPRLAYWGFIRVVANTHDGAPSEQTIAMMKSWEEQESL